MPYKRNPTKTIWHEMKKRCLNPNHRAYKWYGAKGVTIDPRWLDYNQFVKDMGERPEGMSLDRIDPHKGYNPANCRWVSWHVQQANRTNNNLTVGVGLHKASGRWRAYIRPNGRQVSLGYYKTYEEAVAARKKAEADLEWW